MANQPIKMDAGSKVSLFFASLALLVVVVFLVSQVIGWLADMRVSQAEAVSDERVEKRIEPIGEVVSGEMDTSEEPVELAAGDIYSNVCSSCHDAGVSGAPVTGDSDAWSARFDDKGLETLFDHAINGFNAMPARGGDSSLSDEQVRKTVAYMLEEADIEHGYEGADNGAAEGEAKRQPNLKRQPNPKRRARPQAKVRHQQIAPRPVKMPPPRPRSRGQPPPPTQPSTKGPGPPRRFRSTPGIQGADKGVSAPAWAATGPAGRARRFSRRLRARAPSTSPRCWCAIAPGNRSVTRQP